MHRLFCYLIVIYVSLRNNVIPRKVTLHDYCKIDKKNTPCRTKCWQSVKCRGGTYLELFSDEERQFFVDEHNRFRNEVAEGKYANYNAPAAANMAIISYSKELEFVIACWVKQCSDEHDDVRLTTNGSEMGQNLATLNTTINSKLQNLHQSAPRDWFNKIKSFPANITKKFRISATGTIGAASQMLWAKTRFIGCAQMQYKDRTQYLLLVGCNYLPHGNIDSQPIYENGAGASKCENNETANEKYKFLCGNEQPFSADKYVTPIPISKARSSFVFNFSSLFICLLFVIL